MSLPDVQWRYVGRYSYGTGTIPVNTIMDGIYSLATGTSYIDSSSRAMGSGSAGTWSKATGVGGITEAIYVTPPSGSQAIIIAGSSGTPSPSPDMAIELSNNTAYATNKLFVNIIKNPGSFSTWNAANPFTSGSAMGYTPFLGSRTVAATGITSYSGPLYAYLFESRESIGVFLIETGSAATSSYTNGFLAGALIDPKSTHLSDAESDGRLYGIFSTGHQSNASLAQYASWSDTDTSFYLFTSTWHSDINTTSFLYGYRTDTFCSARGGIFEPGTSNVKPVIAGNGVTTMNGTSIARSAVTNSGKYVRLPIIIKGALVSDSVVFGSLRNISLCKDGLIGQRHMDGTTTVGYLLSCSNNSATTAEAVLLEY